MVVYIGILVRMAPDRGRYCVIKLNKSVNYASPKINLGVAYTIYATNMRNTL